MTDNNAALAYENLQDGTQSILFNKHMKEIWTFPK